MLGAGAGAGVDVGVDVGALCGVMVMILRVTTLATPASIASNSNVNVVPIAPAANEPNILFGLPV